MSHRLRTTPLAIPALVIPVLVAALLPAGAQQQQAPPDPLAA
jgi:hypothetical protein